MRFLLTLIYYPPRPICLKKGVDLRYTQDLLGHESSKTTEIYTHITKKSWDKIKSPLDDLEI